MILAVYRDAFLGMPQARKLQPGDTLERMRALMPLPEGFDAHGVICINGHPVPRALWGMIRPKAPAVTEVTFHMPPLGGGDGGKNVLSIVAAIALTALTGGIAAGGVASLGIAGGSTSALLLAGGVSYAGSLLLSSLVPPPTAPNAPKSPGANEGSASASGNVLEPNAAVPRVVGERKVFPPLACEPFIYFEGQDEVVEAIYILNGPHRLENVRIGSASITDLVSIEYETREGWPGDPRINLVQRQARTEALQAELRGHTVSDSDGRTLESVTGDPGSALPQAQTVSTREAPDFHELHLAFPQGLFESSGDPIPLRVPFRMKMRAVGDTEWRWLPEMHFAAGSLKQLRVTIRLHWQGAVDGDAVPAAGNQEGWIEARVFSPGQTDEPATDDWSADPYFASASGDAWMNKDNLGSTAVRNVTMGRYDADIYLDPTDWAPGRYEISIIRGASLRNYSSDTYQVDGSVWDFWGAKGNVIVQSRENRSDTCYLLRSVSIWNDHPLPRGGFAAIAVRARNRQLEGVSCMAGGYVHDWDGTGWNDLVITDNPAPHLRDIFSGRLNLDPVPLALLDDDGLVEWRQHCIDMGYTCNAIIEDMDVDSAAGIVAACGYAKPYRSEVMGVVRDYDRGGEAPVQIFSSRNIASYRFTKAFPRVPDGFRVSFADASRDYDTHQISVYRDGASGDLTEQVSYEGLVHEADVIARAQYDQAQAVSRGTFYSFDVPAEGAIICRRGSLIGLNHDSISAHNGSARVIALETNLDGDVTALEVDAPVPISNEPDLLAATDMLAIPDMLAAGVPSGVAIRRRNGITVHQLANATGSATWLDLADPTIASGLFTDDDKPIDALVTVGPHGREYLRLIVFSVTPRENFEATFTCVDEAPEFWTAA